MGGSLIWCDLHLSLSNRRIGSVSLACQQPFNRLLHGVALLRVAEPLPNLPPGDGDGHFASVVVQPGQLLGPSPCRRFSGLAHPNMQRLAGVEFRDRQLPQVFV